MTYSNFFKRLIGTTIDTLIIASIALVVNRTVPIIGWMVSIGLGLVYYVFFWSSRAQATPGKYLMGTFVKDINGNRITIKMALIRYICSWASAAILCFGYLLPLFTEKRQTLHDLLAGTVVVDDDIQVEEGLFTAWINQIKSLK